jgi:hypothetical protein
MNPGTRGRGGTVPAIALAAILVTSATGLAASPEPALIPLWESSREAHNLATDPCWPALGLYLGQYVRHLRP